MDYFFSELTLLWQKQNVIFHAGDIIHFYRLCSTSVAIQTRQGVVTTALEQGLVTLVSLEGIAHK